MPKNPFVKIEEKEYKNILDEITHNEYEKYFGVNARPWINRQTPDGCLQAVWADTGKPVKLDDYGLPIQEEEKEDLGSLIRKSLCGSVEQNSLESIVQFFENCESEEN